MGNCVLALCDLPSPSFVLNFGMELHLISHFLNIAL